MANRSIAIILYIILCFIIQTSTFQCVLAFDKADLYIMYYYDSILVPADGQFLQQSQDYWIGYIVSDLNHVFDQSFSLKKDVQSTQHANLQIPGQLIYLIKGKTTIL